LPVPVTEVVASGVVPAVVGVVPPTVAVASDVVPVVAVASPAAGTVAVASPAAGRVAVASAPAGTLAVDCVPVSHALKMSINAAQSSTIRFDFLITWRFPPWNIRCKSQALRCAEVTRWSPAQPLPGFHLSNMAGKGNPASLVPRQMKGA